VDVKLSTGTDDLLPDVRTIHQHFRANRPSAATWKTAVSHRGVAADFVDPDPLHHHLYEWLERDLRRAKLLR